MTEEKNECVPRLRFPEFENKQWGTGILSDFISTVSSPNKIQQRDYLQHGKIAIIDQSKKYISGYTNNENNIVSNVIPLIVFGDHTCIIKLINFTFAQGADGIKIFYGNKNISTLYIFYFLNFSPIIMEEYKRHFSILKNKTIYYPIDKNEQQKIADCLSSLDELIEAREQKCNTLKQHKKGLMQRLFPAEGETTPRWRFPEFRDSGEWVEKKIADVCSVTTGKSNTQDKVSNGKYPFYVRSATIERSDKYLYDEEAVLTVGDGVGTGKVYHYINGKYDLHQRCYRLFGFKKILGIFLFYFFSTFFGDRVSKMTAKNSVDSVRMNMITDMQIFLPSLPEQQKIADCLSSLDDRIAAEEERLAVLREHKKGLMQQLFPVI